jgi:hypothetical protein
VNPKRVKHAGLRLGVIVAVAAAVAVPGSISAAAEFTPGSAGLGDPFFPLAGNGGYDVGHYSLRLGYDPATRVLDGTATCVASTSPGWTSTASRPRSAATGRSW